MRLDIFQGDLKEGYFYAISNGKGEAIASGYYRLAKHASYWGKIALSTYEEGKK